MSGMWFGMFLYLLLLVREEVHDGRYTVCETPLRRLPRLPIAVQTVVTQGEITHVYHNVAPDSNS